MDEKTKNKEQNVENNKSSRDFRAEFHDLVEMGAYKSLSNNEFFQGLQPEEQFDSMLEALQNSLKNREQRFSRLVQQKPDLAAEYRDRVIKPLRDAIRALDEIALHDKKDIPQDIFQEDDDILENVV